MKKIVFSCLVVFMLSSGALFASEVFEKKQATVRTDYSISFNGEVVSLQNDIIVINGVSYVPLREVSYLYNSQVDFDNGVIKIESPNVEPIEEEITEITEMTEREKQEQELREISEALKNGTFERPKFYYENKIEELNISIDSDNHSLLHLEEEKRKLIESEAAQSEIDKINSSISSIEKRLVESQAKLEEYTQIINK